MVQLERVYCCFPDILNDSEMWAHTRCKQLESLRHVTDPFLLVNERRWRPITNFTYNIFYSKTNWALRWEKHCVHICLFSRFCSNLKTKTYIDQTHTQYREQNVSSHLLLLLLLLCLPQSVCVTVWATVLLQFVSSCHKMASHLIVPPSAGRCQDQLMLRIFVLPVESFLLALGLRSEVFTRFFLFCWSHQKLINSGIPPTHTPICQKSNACLRERKKRFPSLGSAADSTRSVEGKRVSVVIETTSQRKWQERKKKRQLEKRNEKTTRWGRRRKLDVKQKVNLHGKCSLRPR